MPEPDLITLFLSPLSARGLENYMVSGSLAAVEYGEPRATLDVDVVLWISAAESALLAEAFPEPEYYCPPEDVLASEINRPTRGHFNVIHIASGLKADFYPSRNHPLFPWACRHRRRVEIGGTEIWLAPPEYVILWKLEFFREGGGDKHLRDIKGMLAVSGKEIDQDFLRTHVVALGLDAAWERCLLR